MLACAALGSLAPESVTGFCMMPALEIAVVEGLPSVLGLWLFKFPLPNWIRCVNTKLF